MENAAATLASLLAVLKSSREQVAQEVLDTAIPIEFATKIFYCTGWKIKIYADDRVLPETIRKSLGRRLAARVERECSATFLDDPLARIFRGWLYIWSEYGAKSRLVHRLSVWINTDPANLAGLLEAFARRSTDLSTGVRNKAAFNYHSYDNLAMFINPKRVTAVIRKRYGKIKPIAEGEREKLDQGLRLALEFLAIHATRLARKTNDTAEDTNSQDDAITRGGKEAE